MGRGRGEGSLGPVYVGSAGVQRLPGSDSERQA